MDDPAQVAHALERGQALRDGERRARAGDLRAVRRAAVAPEVEEAQRAGLERVRGAGVVGVREREREVLERGAERADALEPPACEREPRVVVRALFLGGEEVQVREVRAVHLEEVDRHELAPEERELREPGERPSGDEVDEECTPDGELQFCEVGECDRRKVA